jgi:hypothetical protein
VVDALVVASMQRVGHPRRRIRTERDRDRFALKPERGLKALSQRGPAAIAHA